MAKFEESWEIQRTRSEDHHDLAAAAYAAAKMHLEAIVPLTTTYNPQSNVELYARIRAFFWELMAAYDLMHVWANSFYHLEVKPKRLRPEEVQSKMKGEPRCANAYAVLSEAENSAWLFEARTYRNYAHRSYVEAQQLVVQRDNSAFTQLLPSRKGQTEKGMKLIEPQLREYLSAMDQVGKKLGAIKVAPTQAALQI
ncbi:hypothetical protein [Paraburkholderia sp. RL17-373-BIF-A]|uniref:hypothetical protein n=1 Tax=Paraburkholderia sp. RL17-373-BIF-A TaxID=3031629 RepID=UPI0038B967AD